AAYLVLQREVYRQLGPQLRLGRLIPCHRSMSTSVRPYQCDILKMTLQSGMGEVAGLA
ncbi:hypothetical protein BG005_007388, partial [Podila minutissima]